MFTPQERKLLLILSAIQFVHIVDFMIMMPLGPQLLRLFQITPQQFGLLVSCYSLAAGVSGFLTSFFIDRFPRRNALLVFLAGFALGTLACALASQFWVLLLARSLTGFFGGVLGSLVFAIVGDAISVERRGQATGTVMMAFSIASIFGVPASLALAQNDNWHTPFFLLAALTIVIGILIPIWMTRLDEHLKGHENDRFVLFENLNSIAQSPSQKSGILLSSMLILGQFTVIPFLSTSLVANAGMREVDLPMIYFIGGCFTIFSSPLIGRLADKYGNHKIFPIFLFASLIPIFLITHMRGQIALPLILATTAAFFVCTGGRMIPAISMLTSTVDPAHRGSFMSLVSCTQQLSMALSSFLAGMIVSTGPQGEILHYNIVGYIALGFSVISYFVAQRVKRHQTSQTLAS